jgi:2-methylcitrate dehydratase
MRKVFPVDRVLDELTRFTLGVRYDDLPEDIKAAAVERLVDAMGCAIGGYPSDAVAIGRKFAPVLAPGGYRYPARVIGGAERTTTADAAGFINSLMIRHLDFNDAVNGGHPSDSLGPLIALADSIGASGKQLLEALVAGYDIFVRQARAAQLREKGWDQGFGIGLAVVAGAAKLLDLTEEQTRHAFSISAIDIVPLRGTRAGELSTWKGAATSFDASHALAATFLASEGMTGPAKPFEGRHGVFELMSGPFEFGFADGRFHIGRTRLKYWPVEYHLQAAVWAGIELGKQVSVADIADVKISTYWAAWSETGSESAKWDPRTKETADHSMPYIFVRALENGELDHSVFQPECFLDPAVRPSMAKVTVDVDEELEAQFPDVVQMRVALTDTSGNVHRVSIVNPRGHEKNPVTPEEAADKFLRLARPSYSPERSQRMLDGLRAADQANHVSDLLDLMIL